MNLRKDVGKVFNVLQILPHGKAVECPAVLVGFLAEITPVFIAAPREDGFHTTKDYIPENVCQETLKLLEPALANGMAKVLIAAEGFHYVHTYTEKLEGIDPQWYTVSPEKCDELYDYAFQRVYGLMR